MDLDDYKPFRQPPPPLRYNPKHPIHLEYKHKPAIPPLTFFTTHPTNQKQAFHLSPLSIQKRNPAFSFTKPKINPLQNISYPTTPRTHLPGTITTTRRHHLVEVILFQLFVINVSVPLPFRGNY